MELNDSSPGTSFNYSTTGTAPIVYTMLRFKGIVLIGPPDRTYYFCEGRSALDRRHNMSSSYIPFIEAQNNLFIYSISLTCFHFTKNWIKIYFFRSYEIVYGVTEKSLHLFGWSNILVMLYILYLSDLFQKHLCYLLVPIKFCELFY